MLPKQQKCATVKKLSQQLRSSVGQNSVVKTGFAVQDKGCSLFRVVFYIYHWFFSYKFAMYWLCLHWQAMFVAVPASLNIHSLRNSSTHNVLMNSVFEINSGCPIIPPTPSLCAALSVCFRHLAMGNGTTGGLERPER